MPVTNMYNEQLWYDKNGNIQHLNRNGDADFDDANGVLQIDNLEYVYDNDNKNQLKLVLDNTNNPKGFKDSETNDVSDYSYDANGNMTIDRNKEIIKPNGGNGITYNHLNLPVEINFEAEGKINYLYNATGQKVKKTVTYTSIDIDGQTQTITDYLDGYQYTDGKLNFFPHTEGYVKAVGDQNEYRFFYVYNYLDHLGNVRVSYGKDPETNLIKILEQNHYYPFGLKHTNYNTDKRRFTKEQWLQQQSFYRIKPMPVGENVPYDFKFQGQERQFELGLNWDSFKWRNYDYAIGRFFGIDKLTEDYQFQTPYAFSENRVIDGRELEGLERFPVNGQEIVKPVEKVLNTMSTGWNNAMSTIGNSISAADKWINSFSSNKKDNLQGNSQGHFKNGIKFEKKEDTPSNQGLEPANVATNVKIENADFLDLVQGGLDMSKSLTTFEQIAQAGNKIVDVVQKIDEKKTESSNPEMVKVSTEPQKAKQDYQNNNYVRKEFKK